MTDARADAAATMERITPLRRIIRTDIAQLEPLDAVSLLTLLIGDTLKRFPSAIERIAALGALVTTVAESTGDNEPDA